MAEVWKKLLLHKAANALAINVPAAGSGGGTSAAERYRSLVGAVPEEIGLDARGAGSSPPEASSGVYDFVHFFASSLAELEQLTPWAVAAVKYDGLLWVSYPKKSSGIKTDINRDIAWQPLKSAGYDPVTQIAIDDTWSALRFRPTAAIPVMTRKF